MFAPPMVGHIKRPRPGVPWAYVGRTMPGHVGPDSKPLIDRGLGNPFILGKNSDDPVGDYIAFLAGEKPVEGWDGMQRVVIAAILTTIGCDLLCWCHKEPVLLTPDPDKWRCHGEVQLSVRRQWAEAHPADARTLYMQARIGRIGR